MQRASMLTSIDRSDALLQRAADTADLLYRMFEGVVAEQLFQASGDARAGRVELCLDLSSLACTKDQLFSSVSTGGSSLDK